MFFIFCTTDGWWGNSEALRAAERGKSVNFVRLLYIIRLYLSLLFRRQAGIEYNYMLCIIASGCFFWRKCSTVVAVGVQTSFLPFAKSVTEKKNSSRVDCAEADKKTVQTPRFGRLSELTRRVRIFGCWWLPCGASRNNLSGKT